MAVSSDAENSFVPAYLKRIVGDPLGSIIPLRKPEIIVGRVPGCGISIPDAKISRSHCTLRFNSSGWTITDNGAVNGTYVNGTKLLRNSPAALRDGMIIFLGSPEDSPCGFVFLQATQEELLTRSKNRPSSQTASSQPESSKSSFKREADVATSVQDPTKRHKKTPIFKVTTMPHTSSRTLSPKADRFCSVEPCDLSTPGPSFRTEPCGASSSIQRDHHRFMSDRFNSVIRNSEPVPGPSDDCLGSEEDNVSDCSVSSLDSLKTRIRKKQRRESQNLSRRSGGEAGSGEETSAANAASHKSSSPKVEATEQLNGAVRKKIVNSQSAHVMETSQSREDSESSQDSESLLPFANAKDDDFGLEKERNKSEEAESTILFLKERVLKLQSHLLEVSYQLKEVNEKYKEQKRLIDVLQGTKGISQEQLMKVLEEELSCNICTEIYIKPITLSCCHSFCKHCITLWKKTKKQCPICREPITTEMGILVLDNLIDKAIEHLDESYQKRRAEIVLSREEQKKAPVKKKGKKTRRRGPIRIQRIENSFPVSGPINMPTQALQVLENGHIQMVPFPLVPQPSSSTTTFPSGLEILLSDGSDSSVEGGGYYGGFGRCFSCGRRGHWANGCPD